MQLHPHGDAPIYEALVNLAQKGFLMDLPLIRGLAPAVGDDRIAVPPGPRMQHMTPATSSAFSSPPIGAPFSTAPG